MKVNYSEGRSGFFKKGAVLTKQSASFGGGFCLITAKGASSYFDTIKDEALEGGKALEKDMPVYLEAWNSQETCPLKEGDEVIPLEMAMSCWTTDCPVSYSEGSIDRTSQCDLVQGIKDIVGDGVVTESGSISGYYESESEMQRFIEDNFISKIVDEDNKKTFVSMNKEKRYLHWFKTRETTVAGEVETTLIREMLISGFSAGQPTSGAVPFNFSYTTLRSFNYRKKVTA